MVGVLLLLIIHILAVQGGDMCSAPCGGQVGYFSLPEYGPNSLKYLYSPDHLPLQTLQSSNIKRGVVIVHGADRKAQDYYCWMKMGIEIAKKAKSTYIFAPHFLQSGDPIPENTMFWTTGNWKESGMTAATQSPRVSSFKILDDVLLTFSNKSIFPSLSEVILVGHSGGGQTIQRYALTTAIDQQMKALNVKLRYIIENPGSYTYLDKQRPVLTPPVITCTVHNQDNMESERSIEYIEPYPSSSTTSVESTEAYTSPSKEYTFALVDSTTTQKCPEYNDWKMGLDNRLTYANSRSLEDIRSQYILKDVSYILGALDTCNRYFGNCGCNDHGLDISYAANLQGYCRFERGIIYYQYLQHYYNTPKQSPVHKLYTIKNVGHDGCRMLTDEIALQILFPKKSSL